MDVIWCGVVDININIGINWLLMDINCYLIDIKCY